MVPWLRYLIYFLEISAIAYILAGLGLLLAQRRIVFVPCKPIVATPTDYGLPYESVTIPINSEESIHGWWVPAEAENAPVLLYLHGNGGNVSSNLPRVQRYRAVGFSVFLIDYRGYGLSEGRFPSEKRVYEDAETAWRYLVEQREIDPQQLYVFGHSLGGAIALELATRQPQIPGLVVEGTFTSIRDMAVEEKGYGWLPVNWLLTQRFNSVKKVSSLQTPIFFIHGTDDRVVPAYMSERLYRAASGRKELWLVETARHNDVATVAGTAYEKRIWQFLIEEDD
ncbi:alpha/beta hydrolase fold protein [Halothece sp. PCC 7418]|uniref:alpha/beta hydrolase n=1 Tax=Halothece sp. (strain PCC 7418) TaxID=65093 RepID=UPI0002A06697|nr:alpha/beta fold hydrolase [Halothece sp. PCC 7418]AFZ45521.1 alpha/beta hydrolase fold protein [Halothece sp. PCC 7418]